VPPYSTLVDWLEQLLPDSGDTDSVIESSSKRDVLVELQFSTVAAETQDTLVDD
jgi:hypothetical protein